MNDVFQDNEVFDLYPQLAVLPPLVELANAVRWFSTVGEQLKPETCRLAEDYCLGLGFPEAAPALLGAWGDAADAAETLGFNSPSWEAEEQMRAALTQQVAEQIDEETLAFIFNHIANEVLQSATLGAEEIADFLHIDDQAFVQAASGAAVQAVHLAALVLLASEDETHPFAVRFHIFETGHWPIGISGSSFNIF